MSRMYEITKEEVLESWKAVRGAQGGPGFDGKTIKDVEDKLEGELYKIWNRMSSGSYQAQNVKIVEIPKMKGGTRKLGIPNVTDRIAQGVIKKRLEDILEPQFHENSYAYRPNRSAIDAVLLARTRCFEREWVVEIDIKGFFDNIDHGMMMEIVRQYTDDKVILLYAKKFLEAKAVTEEGEEIIRTKGTPQGGVVSPVLANLYLHEAFDKWIQDSYPNIQFERYADDIVVHCVTEKQAVFIKDMIQKRMQIYKLELHPEKTRIVYAGKKNDFDDRKHKLSRKFTFLGYDFKPREWKGKLVFTPAVSKSALKMMNLKLKVLKLGSKTQEDIEHVVKLLNPIVRGWITYYGKTRRSALYKLADYVDKRIVKWIMKKHKIRQHGKAWKFLKEMKRTTPKLFYHWYSINSSFS